MAPDALIMIGALTVPPASPVVLALTESVLLDPAATLPEAGLTLNQELLPEPVQDNVPAPLLLIVTV